MDRVLEGEPQLGDNGFGCGNRAARHGQNARPSFVAIGRTCSSRGRWRSSLAARGWLRRFKKIKTLNRGGTSYGLKHIAEDDIGYTTNGCFIAAAIAEGFAVRRTDYDSPNAWFSISTEAWKHTGAQPGRSATACVEHAHRIGCGRWFHDRRRRGAIVGIANARA